MVSKIIPCMVIVHYKSERKSKFPSFPGISNMDCFHLSLNTVEIMFDLFADFLSRAFCGLQSSHSLSSDIPKIVHHFFWCPPCLSGPRGKVVPQVMEGDILDHFRLVFRTLSFKRAEPIVDPFLRQSLPALRREHIGSCCVAGRLQICI